MVLMVDDMVDGCSMVFEQWIGELVLALRKLKGNCKMNFMLQAFAES